MTHLLCKQVLYGSVLSPLVWRLSLLSSPALQLSLPKRFPRSSCLQRGRKGEGAFMQTALADAAAAAAAMGWWSSVSGLLAIPAEDRMNESSREE